MPRIRRKRASSLLRDFKRKQRILVSGEVVALAFLRWNFGETRLDISSLRSSLSAESGYIIGFTREYRPHDSRSRWRASWYHVRCSFLKSSHAEFTSTVFRIVATSPFRTPTLGPDGHRTHHRPSTYAPTATNSEERGLTVEQCAASSSSRASPIS